MQTTLLLFGFSFFLLLQASVAHESFDNRRGIFSKLRAIAKQDEAADDKPKALLIGSFNMWIFGQSKLRKKNITEAIINVITRYDVIALQEIRDVSNFSAHELKRLVKEKDDDYEFIASGHLGRSASKEQYAFFYRRSKLSVVDQWQYNDKNNYFERPPFFIRFKSSEAFSPDSAMDVAFGNIHTKPEDTVNELIHLTEVYDEIYWKWRPALVLVGGDYNADCNYVTQSKWSNIPLRTNSSFVWMINDSIDSTAGKTDCAYDRFVGLGKEMKTQLVVYSGNVWLYFNDLGFSAEEARKVSDHYPVEFALQADWF